jgi:hypothetical protein
MSNQRGFAHILILVLLIIGLFVAIYLVQDHTNLFPRASVSDPISEPISPEPSSTSIASASATPTASASATPQYSIIKIYAAGTPSDGVYPNMSLMVNGATVQVFKDVRGDPDMRDFRVFNYYSPTVFNIHNVRVRFLNDRFNGWGNDRNLVIDKVILDGVEYQTESQGVFSTGTWSMGNGCSNGYKQSEWLMCKGYFQF